MFSALASLQRRWSERASVCAAHRDRVFELMRLAEEEIHVGRFDFGLVGLFQVSIAARFDPLQVIGRVGVADHPIGAQFIRALGNDHVSIKRNAMLLLFE